MDPQILLKDRLSKGRERLDHALEAIALLCEPVEPPKGELEHIHYFCGNTEISEQLQQREPQRAALYKATAALVRAFANIADELEGAGYSRVEIANLKKELGHYLKLRELIRKASGESIDLKAYEADMRHLIDTYIEADEPRMISPFDGMTLLELIVKSGIADAINSLPDGLKGSQEAVAETIENNVRSKIIKEHLNDPAFYDKMSRLLDEIIKTRKAKAIEYEEYLKRIARLAKTVEAGQAEDTPEQLDSPGKRALYNNLGQVLRMNEVADQAPAYVPGDDATLVLALEIDKAIKSKRPDGWRGEHAREQVVKRAIYEAFSENEIQVAVETVEQIYQIIYQQSEY